MTLVAINVDPNEDESAVRGHVDRHGLVGHFAVPPQSMLDDMVGEFGASLVTPPTSPVVLLSADQTEARLLERGVKTVDDLLAEIE